MKTLFFLLTILISSSVFSQDAIKLAYVGPKNTSELKERIYHSEYSVVQSLDDATKESLVRYTLFDKEKVVGFSGVDDNIKRLYASNFDDVMSAILTMKVKSHPDYIKHDYTVTFDPTAMVARGSWCSNCYTRDNGQGCCATGGSGCVDYVSPTTPINSK